MPEDTLNDGNEAAPSGNGPPTPPGGAPLPGYPTTPPPYRGQFDAQPDTEASTRRSKVVVATAATATGLVLAAAMVLGNRGDDAATEPASATDPADPGQSEPGGGAFDPGTDRRGPPGRRGGLGSAEGSAPDGAIPDDALPDDALPDDADGLDGFGNLPAQPGMPGTGPDSSSGGS